MRWPNVLVALVIVLGAATRGRCQYTCGVGGYYLLNCSYTTFPRNQILAHGPPTSTIQVQYNKLTMINSTDLIGLENTTIFFLTYNSFVEFPDLSYIGNKLDRVYFDYNPMTTIDPARLSPLVALTILSLVYTQLTSFPDAYMPSLNTLFLKGCLLTAVPKVPLLGKRVNQVGLGLNKILSIDAEALYTYTNVTLFSIYGNPNISVFPNFLTLPGNGSKATLQMTSIPWVCDCRMRWLKSRFPYLNITDGATCASPANLAGQVIQNLALSQFTCAGQTKMNYAKALSNFYSSFPPVVARYSARNVLGCARLCALTVDCTQFNIGLRSDVAQGDVNVYYCDVSGSGSAQTFVTSVVSSWDLYTLQ